ncbi:hypothetical protein FNV43_RR14209 [Rhamnella rubrinervis]|uniref:Cystinosin homolog n=1 Tax=Rhamnella rubrinervis TaxID=2594499 RepID=A0A8K0MG45_9ROSA|nr:hypothetical protein FNV43_RR14209 [Rhamnella rubrinervis]
MASWNSNSLGFTYEVLGWIAFTCWAIGFYPQVILNFRRKSVVGLNFDFVVLNFTKHSSYLIYNVTLYFSSTVQKQYFDKYGFREMIPVAANDVAFSIHSVLLVSITLFQIAIYERGSQTISKITIAIVSAVCLTAGAFMNFKRKSTEGFSMGYVLLDFSASVSNFAQLSVQSIDQGSWVNLYGDIGKTMISVISLFFDIVFICQRFLLYPANSNIAVILPKSCEGKKAVILPKSCEGDKDPLINSFTDEPQLRSENNVCD